MSLRSDSNIHLAEILYLSQLQAAYHAMGTIHRIEPSIASQDFENGISPVLLGSEKSIPSN